MRKRGVRIDDEMYNLCIYALDTRCLIHLSYVYNICYIYLTTFWFQVLPVRGHRPPPWYGLTMEGVEPPPWCMCVRALTLPVFYTSSWYVPCVIQGYQPYGGPPSLSETGTYMYIWMYIRDVRGAKRTKEASHGPRKSLRRCS